MILSKQQVDPDKLLACIKKTQDSLDTKSLGDLKEKGRSLHRRATQNRQTVLLLHSLWDEARAFKSEVVAALESLAQQLKDSTECDHCDDAQAPAPGPVAPGAVSVTVSTRPPPKAGAPGNEARPTHPTLPPATPEVFMKLYHIFVERYRKEKAYAKFLAFGKSKDWDVSGFKSDFEDFVAGRKTPPPPGGSPDMGDM
jgi:hypothetical protein